MIESTRWSEPFWEALRQGSFAIPYCQDCDKPHFTPRRFCPHCWSDRLEYRAVSGAGTVYSFTTVRANPPSAFEDLLPYTIAIVELDEGVRMMTHILGNTDDLAIGSRVEVRPQERLGDMLPFFVLEDAQ